ncbi:hypothetical protein AB0M28_13640 [Streptomyces sp. NPDC051940]|uniref:hypothetical protein n=1 Tax=Streptomyces sp. NPDC051940 TaxID=3155675 RepID=UPI00341C70EF
MSTAMTPAVGQTPSRPTAVNTPLVVGLDLSLTSTGIASHNWADAIRPKNRGHNRLWQLTTEIADRVKVADLVVVEGPSYGSQGNSVHQLAGLWWLVVHGLWRRRIPTAICPPAQRAMYATGNGRAGKGEVRTAVAEHFGIECDGPGRYDKADAAAMACLGLDWLGYPVAEMPPEHRRALQGVQWPQTVPAVAR